MSESGLVTEKLPGVIFLMGPTATGKSSLALALANHLSVELINVDSAQVYKGMDIGTAKPGKEILRKYPHHLIDIRDPSQAYSAAEFREDAIRAINDIHLQGKTPLLVGGTMLYFKALKQGLAKMPAADVKVREQLELEAETDLLALYQELETVDPVAAGGIHPNNKQRLIRALEVFRISGRPISNFWENTEKDSKFPWKITELTLTTADRAGLHEKIEQRFQEMLNQGLLKEVEKLYGRGDLSVDLPSIRSVGYRQAWDYLSGELSYSLMQEQGVAATRQLAKRQFTWLKSWQGAIHLDMDDPDLLAKALKSCNSEPM